MAVTVNTTAGTSVTVSVSGSTQASFSTESTSVSVTSPASSTISVLSKGPKGDDGAQGAQGPQGVGVISGGSDNNFLQKDGATDYDLKWSSYTLPAADGTERQVLSTDGAGTLSFGRAVAEHVHLLIRNDEGATINAGTPIYSKGEIGGSDRILVGIADASDPAKMPAIGIAETTLNTTDAKDGYGIITGVFNGNVSGFTGLSEGDILYVSNSGGGLSQTKPTGTYLIQNVGIVLKTNGTILQGLQVSCIGRTNDVPNIPNGQAWIGNASGVATPTTLATVATSGSYNDLSDQPTIPTGDVVDDTTPQLGGDLDVNGNKIVSASNGDIVIDPHGTGAIILKSDDVRLEGTDTSVEVGTVKLYEADVLGDNFVALKAPISIASDLTFTLPAADGSDGQVLKTNGSGTLSFTDALDGVNDTLTGVTQIKDAGGTRGTVSFYDDAGDNFVALRGATTLTSDTVFILPTGDGSADHYLKTDGSGNLSFANPTAKFRQVFSMSFLDDMATTKHYLPWKDINEQTTIYQEEAAMLMPYDGRIVSVTVRPATLSGSGNLTIDVNTAPIGNNIFAPGSFTQEETETLAVTATDDHHGFHFVFDNAQHFEAGDLCSIGIQASADLSSTTYWYVTTIVEFDTATDLGSSSTEHESNP
jgi:hypothetical protein